VTIFQVHDDERVIEFEGRVLAHVSSHESGKTRWIELALYITTAGTYILEGIGHTLMKNEHKRTWAQIADEPEGIIDRLYLYNDLGAKYIPRTSRRLLQEAAERDDGIKQAYLVERVA
jgi:hypothetical protein